ncbi:U4 tri-snRNP-associated snu66 [Fusarium subglutinans]|uniref:U4 tri-snRNP-associated snu66 n=1 Tax=Gibberella subglutinans TaxID=42677 RepID=A0A8H5Q0N0_GIBSU|nr:U4 tri-snRNP-associated snu66 [Fusarium subglutinans]KAF5607210.1 U4 tri-snRNP-associated snu66 [Fusarium subglutinans]
MDAATIEETNRIRISLGMKPLPVPGADNTSQSQSMYADGDAPSTLESRQAQAYDNYNKVVDAEKAKKKREEKAAAVRKARELAQRNAVLEGKGFGEAEEGGDLSAKDWLIGQKKRQKKIAKVRKLEEELAAAEAEAAAAVQYTSKDLAGIKVGHDTADFLDGDDQILTLKDTTIDENEEEGDELENLNMREAEKLAERLDNKKKKPGYNPLDDEEEGERGILSHYDEEIEGKKSKKFTLDTSGVIAELSDILEKPVDKTKNGQNVSLDDVIGDAPISSDYIDPSQIKVKKPKKKKGKKGTRQKPTDDDDLFATETTPIDDAMDIDSKNTTNNKRKAVDDPFVDDDDLQATLAIQRKNALKKRKKTRPEDIARLLREDDEPEPAEQQEGGLVLDEVSEFVAGLTKPGENEERKPRRPKTVSKSPEPDEDHPMGDDAEVAEEKPQSSSVEELDEAGVEEEKAVGAGMGAALALLRERGLVEDTRGDAEYTSLRNREDFLAKKRLLEEELDEQARAQRERDRTSGKLDRMSVREREEWARQQNTWRDQQQSRRMAELFSAGYKPNVDIKYTDDHGRSLDHKEAFKYMSHKFHGKGSGKGKTEKRLKKIEDEKRREAQSMFDASSAGMSLAAQQQLKKRREAGVRLA